jgi:hypothetical protein
MIKDCVESRISKRERKKPWTNGFMTELYQTFKELIPMLLNYSIKLKAKNIPKTFHEDSIALMPKLNKCTTKKRSHSFLDESIWKNHQENTCNLNSTLPW